MSKLFGKILVVDDDEDVLHALRLLLKKHSRFVHTEKNPKQIPTLLKNEDNILPLQGKLKIYVKNLADSIAAQYGTLVDDPADADLAILRIGRPGPGELNTSARRKG